MQHGQTFHQDANNINMLTFFLLGWFLWKCLLLYVCCEEEKMVQQKK
jgi:hypothetical protein